MAQVETTTTRLNNGLIVLARKRRDGTKYAVKYVNLTQARAAARKWSGSRVWGNRPYYIVLNGLPLEVTP